MSKFKHHKNIDLFQSKQKIFFRKLWETLEQRGWTIEQEVVDFGNDILYTGDIPGNVFVSWKLIRSWQSQPVYLDFEAGTADLVGLKIALNDFWYFRLRCHEGKEWDPDSRTSDDIIADVLKTLDEME